MESGYLDRLYVHRNHQRRTSQHCSADKLEAYVYPKGGYHTCVYYGKTLFIKRGYYAIRNNRSPGEEFCSQTMCDGQENSIKHERPHLILSDGASQSSFTTN